MDKDKYFYKLIEKFPDFDSAPDKVAWLEKFTRTMEDYRLSNQRQEIRLKIAENTYATISFDSQEPVTQEAIEKLISLLELQKDTFPDT